MNQTQSENQRIYSYPKSSCNCYSCTNKEYKFPKGKPTNMSVESCAFSKYYNCYNTRNINETQQPSPERPISYSLQNPKAWQNKYSSDFSTINCCDNPSCDGNCPKKRFVSWDPRLWSASHTQYLTLDRAPIEGSVKLKDIYNPNLYKYGKDYCSYDDITAGQILYYVDKSIENPYFIPVFEEEAKVTKVNYKDPMGAMKPQYPRTLSQKNYTTNCDTKDYGLTWIRDSQQYRQDLLTGLMAKNNERRWSNRWGAESSNP